MSDQNNEPSPLIALNDPRIEGDRVMQDFLRSKPFVLRTATLVPDMKGLLGSRKLYKPPSVRQHLSQRASDANSETANRMSEITHNMEKKNK
jgi:hypothetical protein